VNCQKIEKLHLNFKISLIKFIFLILLVVMYYDTGFYFKEKIPSTPGLVLYRRMQIFRRSFGSLFSSFHMIPLSLPFIEVIQAFRRREFGWYIFITKYSILINDGKEQSNAKQKDTKIDYAILTFQPESLIVKYLYPTVSWEF
jgi:hypothetical protein